MMRKTVTLICLTLAATGSFTAFATEIQGTPWTGEPGIVESVKSTMERAQQALPAHRAPRVHPLRHADRTAMASATTPELSLSLSAALANTGPPAQTIGMSFTGARLSDTGSYPPDTMGAVGPRQFIVAVNGRIRTFDKSTGLADGAVDVDTDVFFKSVMTPVSGKIVDNFTSDPHIRYDRLSGRWFIVMIDVPFTNFNSVSNRILLAVSSGGVISSSASFTFFQFRHDLPTTVGDTDSNADYPTLGIDANALYIGDSVFSNSTGSFKGCSGFVVRKSSLTGGGPIVVTAFRELTTASTDGIYVAQGVDNYDRVATEGYFIGTANISQSKLVVRRVLDPGGTPSISSNLKVTVPAMREPITVPHLGNTAGFRGRLDVVDSRLFAAHIRNGRLWTAHNIQVNAAGNASNTGGRTGSRWYELANLDTTPTLVQSGTVFDPAASKPKFYWIPSIMVSGQGHVAMGFSTGGTANYVNAGTCGRLAGDALGTMRTAIDYTASTTAYNPPGDTGSSSGRRWGDYSYTSLDPSDDMTMWTIQQFCNLTNRYSLRVVKLIAPPPATPVSCFPSTILTGMPNVTVEVTGMQVAGSGFFDPGTGFTKRLKAFVGGGVLVNRITYNSPTSVTLDLNTTAATVGSVNITVTNPDAQKITGNGILTVNQSAAPVLTAVQVTLAKEANLTFLSQANALTQSEPSVTALEVINGRKYLSLTVSKAPGTQYQRRIAEVSPNLLDWYSGKKYTTVIQDDAAFLKVRDNTPITPNIKRYIRLKVAGD